MPKLNIITSQTRPTGKLQIQRITAKDLGAGGLTALGQGITKAGGMLLERQERKEEQQAHRAVSDMRVRLTDRMSQTMAASENGAEGFTEQFDELINKEIEDTQPDMTTRRGREAFQQKSQDLKASFMQKAVVMEAEAAREKAVRDYQTQLNNSRNVLLNDPSQFADTLQAQKDYIDTLDIPGNKKQELEVQANRELALSALQRQIMIDPDSTEQDLLGGRWDKYIDADSKAQMLSMLRSSRSANKSETKAALRRVEDRMREGLDIPGEELEAVDSLVSRVDDSQIHQDWANLRAIQAQNSQLRGMHPSDVQQYINGTLSPKVNDTATDREFTLFDSANKLLGKMRSQLNKDPLTWAARAGQVELNDLRSANGYEKRRAVAAQVADFYGVETNPFTSAEAADISQRLSVASPTEQLQELNRMVEGLGDMAPDALAQLGQEDDVMAHAASLLAITPETHTGVALQVLEGHKMLADDPKTAQLLGGETGATLAFREATAGAFQNTPRIAKSARNAANALYTRMAVKEGETVFNRDLYEQAVSLVMGGNGSDSVVDTRNSMTYVLPPGLTGSQFDDVLETMSQQDLTDRFSETGLAPMFEDSTVATPEQIEDEGRFHFIGHGRYLVSMQDGGFLLGGGPNGYYVFKVDADAVAQYQRDRIDAAPADFPGGS